MKGRGVCSVSSLVAENGAAISLLVTFRIAKVEAYEFVFAARVKQAVGESGVSADLSGKNLRSVQRLERRRGGRGTNEFALFGYNEQLISNKCKRGRAECVFLPADFAGFQFDTTETRGWFEAGIGSAMNAEEEAIEINARRVVI